MNPTDNRQNHVPGPTPWRMLFVCLGNICRSPAAEEIMRQAVRRRGLDADFILDSAGIGSWHVGDLPDARMRRHGVRRGYDFCHRARQFHGSQDFDAFDLILVMDHENRHAIMAQALTDAERAKVHLMLEHPGPFKGENEVPDPYYGGDAGFEHVIDLLEASCEAWLDHLTRGGRHEGH